MNAFSRKWCEIITSWWLKVSRDNRCAKYSIENVILYFRILFFLFYFKILSLQTWESKQNILLEHFIVASWMEAFWWVSTKCNNYISHQFIRTFNSRMCIIAFTNRIVTKLIEVFIKLKPFRNAYTNTWYTYFEHTHIHYGKYHNMRHFISIVPMNKNLPVYCTPIYNFIKSVNIICILMKWMYHFIITIVLYLCYSWTRMSWNAIISYQWIMF